MNYINAMTRPFTLVVNARRRIADRKILLLLNDEQLSDIGITRMQAIEEAKKPFWK